MPFEPVRLADDLEPHEDVHLAHFDGGQAAIIGGETGLPGVYREAECVGV